MPMTGRIVSALSLIALALGLAGCGGDGEPTTTTFDTDTTFTTTTTTTETTPEETTRLRVYFLLDGKVQAVAREVPKTQAVASAALEQLRAGPNTTERELGMTSSLAAHAHVVSVENDVASVEVDGALGRKGLAQLVYTATQFPTVKAVEVDGNQYTRRSFEDETPAILVESPLPFETVGNPLRAKGTANTFEATFNYEVIDPAGKVVDENFVTATSGTGTRGTFDFTTKRYTGKAGQGALVVFEISAKDGSRTKEVRIPIRLEP
jgi:Immunoglobulin-like domain of bacterial spore germination/Sporulation and spore germination